MSTARTTTLRIRGIRRIGACLVAVAAVSVSGALSADAQPTLAGAQVGTVETVLAPDASAPCIVTGYTLHADQQMAARNISSDYVEQVVYTYCKRATRRTSNNTWQYTDGKIIVSANDNGYVVTVIRR